jgi:PAS domain S-box-containing protein
MTVHYHRLGNILSARFDARPRHGDAGMLRSLEGCRPATLAPYAALAALVEWLRGRGCAAAAALNATNGFAATQAGRFAAAALPRLRTVSRWTKSITAKMVIVVAVFIAIPLIVYQRFEAADQEKTVLLLESTLEQGRLIAVQLAPLMRRGPSALPRIDRALKSLASDRLNVRILYRPAAKRADDGFYYVASSPPRAAAFLDAEQAELTKLGVLSRLETSCRENRAIGLRHAAKSGSEELITSVTPVLTRSGCWGIVTSHSDKGFLASSLGKAYWEAPEVQFAAALYLALAVLVMIVLGRIWKSLRTFRRIAVEIGRRRSGQSFVEQNQTPELDDVAAQFDHMVQQLGMLYVAVERSPNPIVITDAQGHTEYANHAFGVLTGYSAVESIRRNPIALVVDSAQPDLWPEIRDSMARGMVWNREVPSAKRDGTFYWSHLSVYPMRGLQDEAERFVWIQRDITERKRLLSELVEAKQRAEYATQTKSGFLASMSHELRTPLNAILGFSEVIESEMYGPCNVPQYVEYARNVHRSGMHLLSLINDILDLSKLEAGKMELTREEVDLHEVAREVANMLTTEAGRCNVSMIVDAAATRSRLVADRRAIKQILINLLSNGVKFTPAGGSVSVGTRTEPGGAIRLTVADTGRGIAAADLSKVMDPYVQVGPDFVRKKEGTGLGLPIVKKLVEMHGADLRIASALGVGTTVDIVFPPSAAESSAAPRPALSGAAA